MATNENQQIANGDKSQNNIVNVTKDNSAIRIRQRHSLQPLELSLS
jgi:hypothetical protein